MGGSPVVCSVDSNLNGKRSKCNLCIKIIANSCCGNMRGNVHTLCLVVHLISQLDGMILVTTSHFLFIFPDHKTTNVPGIALMEHGYKLGWEIMSMTLYEW